jgi:hypothetical protein
MSIDEVFSQGKIARRNGKPLDSNPWFGGGKTEAANQVKWEMGWKEEDQRAPRQETVPTI